MIMLILWLAVGNLRVQADSMVARQGHVIYISTPKSVRSALPLAKFGSSTSDCDRAGEILRRAQDDLPWENHHAGPLITSGFALTMQRVIRCEDFFRGQAPSEKRLPAQARQAGLPS